MPSIKGHGEAPLSGQISESLFGIIVRAAASGFDSSQAAGSQIVPIASRAALAAQAYTNQRLLVDGVVRGDDGAAWSAVAARNWDADGDAGSTLIGLLVNARLATVTGASGGATANRLYADLPSGISGTTDTAVFALWTASYCVGRDTTGAAVARPVEARNWDADADVISTLVGLLVNARNAVFEVGGDWRGWNGALAANIPGTSTSSPVVAYTGSIVVGFDTTGAAVLRPVEARNADADADYDAALIGILTNSRIARTSAYTGSLVAARMVRANDTLDESGVIWDAVRAQLGGLDTSLGVGSQARPIEARDAVTGADFAAALIGLVVNARLGGPTGASAGASSERVWTDLPSSISGTGTATVVGLYANAIATGLDNTGAAVLRPVEARNFDAAVDVAAALIGLLVNARQAAFRVETGDFARVDLDTPSFAAGLGTGTRFATFSVANVFGSDSTGAAVMRPVEARNADAEGDVDAALIGFLTNARLAVFGEDGSFKRARSQGMSTVSNESSQFILVKAALAGRDTSAGAGSQVTAVEARNADANGDFTETLIGLLTNSRLGVFSSAIYGGSSGYEILEGFRDQSSSVSGLVSATLRESGYLSAIAGRRFIATSQTAGATLTAQAAFVATTPTLMLRQAAGATETEVVRSISITSFAATPAGIRVVVMLDPDDRFSAGGTSVTPQNPNEGSAAASGITSFLENPTATAADADERIVYNEGFAGGVGAKLVLEFKDELILAGVGTILIYVFDSAGAAAPTIAYNVEFEEYV